jgi:homoserine/homoserine lactone efflux protein
MIGALFPQFVGPDTGNLTDKTILNFTFATMCFFNHVFLALFGGRMREFLRSDHIVKRVRHTLGVVFIGFGAMLATYDR